jgi:hypothetical protein
MSQSVGFQCVGIGFDYDFPLQISEDFNGCDSGEADQFVPDVVFGGLPQLVEVCDFGMGKEDHNHRACVGIELADCHFVRLGILSETGHGFLEIEKGFVHIGFPGIFDRNQRLPDLGDRRDIGHIFLAGGLRFHWRGEFLLHLFRRQFSGSDSDIELGAVKIGQEVHTQPLEGDVSQQQDGQDDH